MSTSSQLLAQQSLWKKVSEKEISDLDQEQELFPNEAGYYKLSINNLQRILETAPAEEDINLAESNTTIPIPLPNGKMMNFRIVNYEMLEPELAAKYPEIQNYRGVGVEEPSASIRLDWTATGFRAMIAFGKERIFVDPYSRSTKEYYLSYYKKDYPNTQNSRCHFGSGKVPNHHEEVEHKSAAGDCQFRRYRLAVATTGEYSNFFGANSAAQSGLVLAAVNSAINRNNMVYERDLGVRMVLIANTDQLFYYNPATDPYTNNDGGAMLGENQTNVDNVIGNGNYDIGHVFSTGGGGIAGLGVVCNNDFKAQGVTGSGNPTNDPFWIDLVAHELGHQFGANHTFNVNTGSCNDNRSNATAMETGSGSTIMAYADICAPNNVQSASDDLFHAISLQEIGTYITVGDGNTCPTVISTANTAPTVTDPGNFSIPRNTPFVLSTTSNDANGDNITYTWEQYDNEISPTDKPNANNAVGPLFRAFDVNPSAERYFPALPSNNTIWEVLPNVSRNMDFRVTVRDNNANYGCTDEQDVSVTVTNAAPFQVTAPNTAINLPGGSTYNVTWTVGQTNQNPINCANVEILLSTDSGLTFPTTLLASTPNDGIQNVIIPNVTTGSARILVKCASNIFYDLSDVNFQINGGTGGGDGTCANPIVINCGDNVNGNTNTGQNNISDYGLGISLSGPELIYSFQAAPGALTANLTGLTADLDLILLSDCNNPTGTVVAQGTSGSTSTESLTFNITNPGTYFLVIDGFNGASSAFNLSLACTGGGGGGGNGSCAAPFAIQCGDNDSKNTNTGQNNIEDYNIGFLLTGPELIYEVLAGAGTFTANLSGMTADLDMILLSDCNNPTGTVIATATTSSTSTESLTTNLANAGTYYLVIDGFNGASSAFNLSLTCSGGGGGPCAPTLVINDNPIPTGTYRAGNTLTSTGRVAAGTTVTFEAGQSITLSPGFRAEAGATFTARIQICTAAVPDEEIEARTTDVAVENEIEIYPNPFQASTTLALNLKEQTTVSIQLYDLTGRRPHQIVPMSEQASGLHHFQINADGLRSGTYIVAIQLGDQMTSKRVILLK
ncbi:MAG: reprolysin-like metallopeptidase [Bacteroidota bacterium]